MKVMNERMLKNVVHLYRDKKLNGIDIARRFSIPIRQVYRILDKRAITRRKINESNALRFLRTPTSFKAKRGFSGQDKLLWMAGIMLYWAEGAKRGDKYVLDLANSDPLMIRIYLRFLREICGIQEKRLRVYLYCFANQNVTDLISFWSRTTHIPSRQFTKPYIQKNFREEKKGRMAFGLVHIRYADKKLYALRERWQGEAVKIFIKGR